MKDALNCLDRAWDLPPRPKHFRRLVPFRFTLIIRPPPMGVAEECAGFRRLELPRHQAGPTRMPASTRHARESRVIGARTRQETDKKRHGMRILQVMERVFRTGGHLLAC